MTDSRERQLPYIRIFRPPFHAIVNGAATRFNGYSRERDAWIAGRFPCGGYSAIQPGGGPTVPSHEATLEGGAKIAGRRLHSCY